MSAKHANKKRRILYGISRNSYQRLEGALQYAREHNWTLCLDTALTWTIPMRWQGDGIIALLDEGSELTDYVLRRPEPKVFIENTLNKASEPCVMNDNRQAGRMAAEYFIGHGFNNYAFVKLRDMYFNYDQISGFRDTLTEQGYTCHTHAFSDPANKSKNPETWLRNILRKLPKPMAIFAADDILATDMVQLALEMNIRVPQDVAVLGTPNIKEIVTASSVQVSSIEMDEAGLVYRACELLDAILDGAQPPKEPILVPPHGIIERASTNIVVFGDRLVREAINIMRSRLSQQIGIEQIAAELNIDRRQLAVAFRKTLNLSPHEVLREQRLRKVKELLLSTDLTLPVIAKRTGFNTHQYLCRFFKTATGQTPSAFRHS